MIYIPWNKLSLGPVLEGLGSIVNLFGNGHHFLSLFKSGIVEKSICLLIELILFKSVRVQAC